jgi:predicted XRE-type DNA-binding protein
MNKEKFLKKLKRHIFDKYTTQSKAAEVYGIKAPHISNICKGVRSPTKAILEDMGFEKITKKITEVSYVRKRVEK